MTTLKLSVIDAPEKIRPTKAPEYGVVTDALKAADQGKAVSFELPAAEHQKLLKELRRDIPTNTVRSILDGDKVTVWLVEKIVRAPRVTEGAEAETSETAADA